MIAPVGWFLRAGLEVRVDGAADRNAAPAGSLLVGPPGLRARGVEPVGVAPLLPLRPGHAHPPGVEPRAERLDALADHFVGIVAVGGGGRGGALGLGTAGRGGQAGGEDDETLHRYCLPNGMLPIPTKRRKTQGFRARFSRTSASSRAERMRERPFGANGAGPPCGPAAPARRSARIARVATAAPIE